MVDFEALQNYVLKKRSINLFEIDVAAVVCFSAPDSPFAGLYFIYDTFTALMNTVNTEKKKKDSSSSRGAGSSNYLPERVTV